MIRPAVTGDVPQLVSLYKKHQGEMGCAWQIESDADLVETFARAVASPDYLCLIGEGCLLLAVSFKSPLGAGRLAQELCFCVTPGHLDRVIAFYEDWARARGCRKSSLSCDRRHTAFERLYGRLGYALDESTFSKVL